MEKVGHTFFFSRTYQHEQGSLWVKILEQSGAETGCVPAKLKSDMGTRVWTLFTDKTAGEFLEKNAC